MLVKDVMMMQTVSCTPSDSLARVMAQMLEHDFGCLPVVDQTGKVGAVITDRDVAVAACLQDVPLSQLPVTGSMSFDAVTCKPTDSVAKAGHKMKERQIRRLPVVDDDGRLVGIVALNDLAVSVRPEILKGVRDEAAHATLEAICGVSEHRSKTPVVNVGRPVAEKKTPGKKEVKAPRPRKGQTEVGTAGA